MARRKDVMLSLKGEARQEESVYIPVAGDVTERVDDNASTGGPEVVVFKLIDTKRKGGTYIPGVDDVIDPDTGRPARIRLLSGVDTIWVKNQKDVTEEYIRQNLRSLHFPRGQKFMAIPTWDKTAIEFARACRHNVGAPNRKTGSKWEFFEYNPEKQAQEALKNELFEIEMITAAQKQTSDFMRKHAAYLGITLADQFGFPKTDDAIRREYIVYAKRNPRQFAKTLESKEIEVSFLVRKALSEQIIDISSVGGNAVWARNMSTICRMPPAVNPIEHLTGLALTNSQEGRDLLEGLKALA